MSRAGLEEGQAVENKQVIDSTIRSVSTIRGCRGLVVQIRVQCPSLVHLDFIDVECPYERGPSLLLVVKPDDVAIVAGLVFTAALVD